MAPEGNKSESDNPAPKTSLGAPRAMGSVFNPDVSRSSTTTPPHSQQQIKQKGYVGPGPMRGGYKRVPSARGFHHPGKDHSGKAKGESAENLKKLAKNLSTTSLKKNTSHTSLKHVRSSTDVSKRPKSAHSKEDIKRPTSVHFEIGSGEDGWEEASSSASPAVSRSVSRPSSRQSPSRASANESRPVSSLERRSHSADGTKNKADKKHSQLAHAVVVTERLLQRTPLHNTAKMPLTTVSSSSHQSISSMKEGSTPTDTHGTPGDGTDAGEIVLESTPSSLGGPPNSTTFSSPHRFHNHNPSVSLDSSHSDQKPQRAHSMGNLQHTPTSMPDQQSAPSPSYKSSLTPSSSNLSTYIPPQQSRTQQKLWLQRASSNMEPQSVTSASAGLNAGGLSFFSAAATSIDVGTNVGGDGYDHGGIVNARIKILRMRTGLGYLAIREFYDPVGSGLRRIGCGSGRDRTTGGIMIGGRAQERLRELERERGSARSWGGSLSSNFSNANSGARGMEINAEAMTRARGRAEGWGRESKGSFGSQVTIAQEDGTGEGELGGSSGLGLGYVAAGDSERGESVDNRVTALLRSLWEKPLDVDQGAH